MGRAAQCRTIVKARHSCNNATLAGHVFGRFMEEGRFDHFGAARLLELGRRLRCNWVATTAVLTRRRLVATSDKSVATSVAISTSKIPRFTGIVAM